MTTASTRSKALVTGASGLIGSSLVRHLVANGFDVTAVYTTEAHLFRLEDVRGHVQLARADLCNPQAVDDMLAQAKPDFVFHLAAAGVNQEAEGEQIIRVNVEGSAILGKAAIRHCVKRFVYTGSGYEYEPRGVPVTEDVPLRAMNYYCATKSAGWQILDYLCRHEDLPLVTVRPFSVYGPMERETKLIPLVIGKGLQREKIELTSGLQVRDYVYVDDVADALLRCAGAPDRAVLGEVFNLGAGKNGARAVRDVVKLALDRAGADTELVSFGKASRSRHEPPFHVADITKIGYRLGWYPTTPLAEGLTATAAFIRSRLDREGVL